MIAPGIAMIGEPELELLCAHLVRKRGEADVPTTSPFGASEPFDRDGTVERYRTGWDRGLADVGWRRTWAVVDDGVVRGHLDLQSGRIPSELHRAWLGIGLERTHRARGLGRTLMTTAIAWAREHGLHWIDLGVFSTNVRAHALYLRLGFVEIGTTRDRFRVDGASIDDIAMTLAL
ncbi:MAG: GNAT family N-acetyltransferase [Deltaproteobacteria bacterium]|nr:GNAT family N-acetyltransferase [Deltaproteobacteria bacterium]MCW5801756.1 GNAT family N-acetyltransferase [Deltaproteobacteria bacterium]